MPTVRARISGAFTLPQIESAIQCEEANFKEFISSTISDNDNLMEFKIRELGEIPNDLILTPSSAPPPSESARIWEGIMFVGGATVEVTVWRKQD